LCSGQLLPMLRIALDHQYVCWDAFEMPFAETWRDS
jgi:hypothetical protein